MEHDEKYEEFRKHYENAETREQQYIVIITKQAMKIKELEKKLASK